MPNLKNATSLIHDILNMKIVLLNLLILFGCVTGSNGCRANKDFKLSKIMMEDTNTAPYMDIFFANHTCSMHEPINDGRQCYIYCNSGFESCVGFAYIGSDCFICEKEVNGIGIPVTVRTKLHIWKSYMLNLDPCDSAPCAHGNCTKTLGSFECTCEPDYGGRICDSHIEECQSRCVNGNCSENANGFKCICDPGFKGVNCDVEKDECMSSPCINGRCFDRLNYYMCYCHGGFAGEICAENINDCVNNTCVHGNCIDGLMSYTCACYNGFTGDNCEVNIDDCPDNNCVNGSCIDGNETYTCSCDVGFTGEFCDECENEHDLLEMVADDAFSAMSEASEDREAAESRHGANAWSPVVHAAGQWIQVDLGMTCLVTRVCTRGKESVYVTHYILRASMNGTAWQ